MERREAIATVFERGGPYIGGVITLVVALSERAWVVNTFHASGMSSKDAAGASFNLMAMFTAFLFSVFVIAIAPTDGFLQKIFTTKTFAIFRRYVVEALVAGLLATVIAFPFMTTPSGSGIWNHWWAVAMLATLLVTAALGFLRAGHIFLVWASYPNRKRAKG